MKIQIIVGSTRQGRQSDKLAKLVANEALKNGSEVETVDLLDYDLPMFNEAVSPQFNPKRQPVAIVREWLDKLNEADGYVLVTPEYNRSIAGVLKNALDYVDFQLQKKPVAIVAHGSSGGAQAAAHLRGIIPGLLAVTVPQAVYFTDQISEVIDEKGNLNEKIKSNPYGPQKALDNTLKSLEWYTNALAIARKIS